ncbi:MAG: hypothetical protein JRN62_08155 [Nitrososphaerota archaeon]|nr:hypothetical protein [Nitrososphaerota archaeon]
MGFRFHVEEVDFPKLGLNLHWGTLNFSKAHHDLAPQIFVTPSVVHYLSYYGKIIPGGTNITHFALPESTAAASRKYSDP